MIFKCNHDYKVTERSNALQLDDMGYPLRLFIVKCCKCGNSKQRWYDVPQKELNEIETGKSFILNWEEVK